MDIKIKRNLFIGTILITLVISFVVLNGINKIISPVLLNYTELEMQKISTTIINRAVNKQLANNIDINELFTIIKSPTGEIQTIDFNPTIVNKVLNTTTNVVLVNLKAIEEGNIDLIELPEILIGKEDNLKKGIVYELPIGVVTNNTFLSNLGPKIPIKLNVISGVESNIDTSIKEYGINNALIEVYVDVSVTLQVNIPFISKRVKVESKIPVAMKVIQGIVPKYYGGNLSEKSNILSIPIE